MRVWVENEQTMNHILRGAETHRVFHCFQRKQCLWRFANFVVGFSAGLVAVNERWFWISFRLVCQKKAHNKIHQMIGPTGKLFPHDTFHGIPRQLLPLKVTLLSYLPKWFDNDHDYVGSLSAIFIVKERMKHDNRFRCQGFERTFHFAMVFNEHLIELETMVLALQRHFQRNGRFNSSASPWTVCLLLPFNRSEVKLTEYHLLSNHHCHVIVPKNQIPSDTKTLASIQLSPFIMKSNGNHIQAISIAADAVIDNDQDHDVYYSFIRGDGYCSQLINVSNIS